MRSSTVFPNSSPTYEIIHKVLQSTLHRFSQFAIRMDTNEICVAEIGRLVKQTLLGGGMFSSVGLPQKGIYSLNLLLTLLLTHSN